MREPLAFAAVVAIGVAILMIAALGRGCVQCPASDSTCSTLPPMPEPLPPGPPVERARDAGR